MKISREDVLRVAQLAHLELAPEEVETYRGQLDEILSYIGKLQELDVSNVEPMTQMRATERRRRRAQRRAPCTDSSQSSATTWWSPATWPKPCWPRLPTPPSLSSESPR